MFSLCFASGCSHFSCFMWVHFFPNSSFFCFSRPKLPWEVCVKVMTIVIIVTLLLHIINLIRKRFYVKKYKNPNYNIGQLTNMPNHKNLKVLSFDPIPDGTFWVRFWRLRRIESRVSESNSKKCRKTRNDQSCQVSFFCFNFSLNAVLKNCWKKLIQDF